MHVMDYFLCTYIAVFSLRRQMAPQQTAKFRIAFFGQFLQV